MRRNKSRLFLLSASARAHAEAARRRQRLVIALDGFADADLEAARVVRTELDEGQFTPEVLELVPRLARPGDLLAYGSGFEARPGLLDELREHVQVLGNPPEVVRLCADPAALADRLAELGVGGPEVRRRKPECLDGWLMKRAGRSGGQHVVPGAWTERDLGGHCWQRFCEGRAYSALFLAAGRECEVVGLSRLLSADSDSAPYAWSGAIGPVAVAPEVHKQVQWAAETLTRGVGLLGLCGFDFIVDSRKKLQVIDLNPRLVATCELYRDRFAADYMTAHVETCLAGRSDGHLVPEAAEAGSVYGMRVVYAPWTVVGVEDLDWPEGCADLPQAGVAVEAGQPLCTVRGRYAGVEAARVGLQYLRGQVLRHLFCGPATPSFTKRSVHEVAH